MRMVFVLRQPRLVPIFPDEAKKLNTPSLRGITSGGSAEDARNAIRAMMSDGKDLRSERLTDRKHELRRLLSKVPASRMRYVEHVTQHGTALFKHVCKMDLEGIVAKHSFGPYVTEPQKTTWFKIKNKSYSQMEGREELFERERHNEPAPGWHSCELACAELE
jgi:hypothetical protein